MTDLQFLVVIMLTICAASWLIYNVSAFVWLFRNRMIGRVNFEWPFFVFTPLSIGWLVGMWWMFL
jgi:hypothetical protein